MQAFRFPPSWQIKGSELSIGLQVNELNGFHFVSRPLLFFLQCNGLIDSQSPLVRRWHTLLFLSTSVSPLTAIVGPFADLKYSFPESIVLHIFSLSYNVFKKITNFKQLSAIVGPYVDLKYFFSPLWRCLQTGPPQKCLDCPSKFPCCVLLALSWNTTTTNKNPRTDTLSRAIN